MTRDEKKVVALEAASRIYEGKGGVAYEVPSNVKEYADKFLEWLEDENK